MLGNEIIGEVVLPLPKQTDMDDDRDVSKRTMEGDVQSIRQPKQARITGEALKCSQGEKTDACHQGLEGVDPRKGNAQMDQVAELDLSELLRAGLQDQEQRFWMTANAVVSTAAQTHSIDESADGNEGAWLTLRVISDPLGVKFTGVGSRFWSASCVLAQLLLRPTPLGPHWVARLGKSKPLRVLELGAGTAVPSICMASAGHAVIATDLPHIVPLTRLNIAANSMLFSIEGPVVETLRWGDESAAAALGHFDLVLGSDLVYDPAEFQPLLRTFRALTFDHALLAAVLRPEDLGEETFENYCKDEGVRLDFRHTEFSGSRGSHRVNVYELSGGSLCCTQSVCERSFATFDACTD